jgi:hypothetical protein
VTLQATVEVPAEHVEALHAVQGPPEFATTRVLHVLPSVHALHVRSAVTLQEFAYWPAAQFEVLHAVQEPPDVATARVDQVEPAEQGVQEVSALAVHATVAWPATHELALQAGHCAFVVPATLKLLLAQAMHTASAEAVHAWRLWPAEQDGVEHVEGHDALFVPDEL